MKTSVFLLTLLLSCASGAELGAADKFIIKNGGMAQGDDLPDEWRGKSGEIQAARDA